MKNDTFAAQSFGSDPSSEGGGLNAFIVSIHDVSPWTQKEVEVMLKDLKRHGVNYCSLLVIPDHHGRGAMSQYPSFISWLHEQVAQGHEVVLHGYEHLRPSRKLEGCFTRWITQCYTAGEGEFYDLSYEEACAKLRNGRKQLQQAGLEQIDVIGFIAPAWLLSSEAERALRNEEFSYTTRLGAVIDLVQSKIYSSQSMVYSVRSWWRRQLSLLWNEGLFFFLKLKKKPLLRLGLHPPDWRYDSIRHHALATVQRALRNYTPMTYRSWIAQSKEPIARSRPLLSSKISVLTGEGESL